MLDELGPLGVLFCCKAMEAGSNFSSGLPALLPCQRQKPLDMAQKNPATLKLLQKRADKASKKEKAPRTDGAKL